MNNNAKKKHMGKIVTVTGWGSGDGKTTTAIFFHDFLRVSQLTFANK